MATYETVQTDNNGDRHSTGQMNARELGEYLLRATGARDPHPTYPVRITIETLDGCTEIVAGYEFVTVE